MCSAMSLAHVDKATCAACAPQCLLYMWMTFSMLYCLESSTSFLFNGSRGFWLILWPLGHPKLSADDKLLQKNIVVCLGANEIYHVLVLQHHSFLLLCCFLISLYEDFLRFLFLLLSPVISIVFSSASPHPCYLMKLRICSVNVLTSRRWLVPEDHKFSHKFTQVEGLIVLPIIKSVPWCDEIPLMTMLEITNPKAKVVSQTVWIISAAAKFHNPDRGLSPSLLLVDV